MKWFVTITRQCPESLKQKSQGGDSAPDRDNVDVLAQESQLPAAGRGLATQVHGAQGMGHPSALGQSNPLCFTSCTYCTVMSNAISDV